MGIGRELFFLAAKKIDDTSSKWIDREVLEDENGITEIINFRARKIHTRALKIYKTTVKVKNDTEIFVENSKQKIEFLKSDIESVELKLTFIFSTFYCILCGLIGVLLILGGPTIPLGLLTFIVPFYTALIRTVKIKLKNGKNIKVYYNLKNDHEVLTNKLYAQSK